MATRDRDTVNREGEESFLSRWSQRKRAAEAEAEEKDAGKPRSAETAAAVGEPGGAAEPDDGRIDPAELPDIDSLDADSDFTVFLKDGVPDALRRRALRKLWRLDPVFGHLDGLNDYDLDYTNAATVVEGLKTVYQVGKGMVLGEEEERGEGATAPPESAGGETPSKGNPRAAGAKVPETTQSGPAGTASIDAEAGGPGGAPAAAAKTRTRNPGDPLVKPGPTRTRPAERTPQRSALQRRWGDPET